jgi:trk system potassium uptake protein
VLAVTFLSLIAAGTGLLRLPVASTGQPLSFVDALFTATSAVCVTGLIVVDTPHDLSLFGQVVVLTLIQLGGLGYMVITTVVAVAIGRQLTIQERLTLQEALNVDSLEGLARFGLTVLKVTLAFEFVGALLLTARFAGEFGLARGAYYAVFHAVSAFNNAGFSLFSDSLIGYRSDWFVNAVVMTLVISGGLGFVVLTEVGRHRRRERLTIHTRLVLSVTAILIVAATTAVFLIERQNPRTLAGLPLADALLSSLFQAVTPRTAGFNTLDTGALMPGSLFLLMLLMFVGAAPGGTAGGIKITTFSVTLAVLWAMVRGAAEPTVLRRRIAPALVARVLSISLIAFLALNVTAGILLLVEGRALLPTLFEATSAFGTVGLSMGEGNAPVSLAGHFSTAGKLLIVVMMFSGRLGPLTLAVAIVRGARPARVRYPVGRILVG